MRSTFAIPTEIKMYYDVKKDRMQGKFFQTGFQKQRNRFCVMEGEVILCPIKGKYFSKY